MKIFRELPISFLLAITLLAAIGAALLYSANGGEHTGWPLIHAVRFGVCMMGLLIIAAIPPKLFMMFAYPIYFMCLVLLVFVETSGIVGKGAQRWLDIGGLKLQPSELMKIALVLVLARYFNEATETEARQPLFLIPALLLIAMPVALVLLQPNLGTSLLLTCGGAAILFFAGVPIAWFVTLIVLAAAAIPFAWELVLHDYQKARVMTFLDPSLDPLGKGYHITQSKIAIGSGGFWGKGYMQGSQNSLDFLPEKHTDFIFTILAEEFGLVGTWGMLALCGYIIFYCYRVAQLTPHSFCRLMCGGIAVTFFLYILINVGMISGIFPVVGIPFPLLSYGGTSMLTMMIGFGLVAGAYREAMTRRRSF